MTVNNLIIDYFQDVKHVHVVPTRLLPLGLCLLQFRTLVIKQSMINTGASALAP